jgi:tRNA(fMet)-specific endonuclease VapC
MIQLDSNILIGLLNRRPLSFRPRFDAMVTSGQPIAISVIVHHELMFGAAASQAPENNERNFLSLLSRGVAVLPFDDADAREAADIRAHLKRSGTPIGPYDVLIAAQARRRGATLATGNAREFRRVPGLRIDDWAV